MIMILISLWLSDAREIIPYNRNFCTFSGTKKTQLIPDSFFDFRATFENVFQIPLERGMIP